MSERNFSEKLFLAQMVQDRSFFNSVKRKGYPASIMNSEMYREVFRHLMKCQWAEVKEDLILDSVARDNGYKNVKAKLVAAKVKEVFSEEKITSPLSIDLVENYAAHITIREIALDSMTALTQDGDIDRAIDIMSRASMLKAERRVSYELYKYNDIEAWNKREKMRHDRILNPKRVLYWNKMFWNASYMPFGQPSSTMIAVSAQTGVGKSLWSLNYAWEAASPPNSLNTLIVIAENRYIEAASRQDAILLNQSYDIVREKSTNNKTGDIFFSNQENWGDVFIVKCVPTKFSAATVAEIIEEIKDDHGVEIECLIVDSPDHMRTIETFRGQSYEKLGQITWELKAVVDMYDLICLITAQLNRSAGSNGKITTEDIGKSYEIAQILDGLFVMYNTAVDRTKSIRRGEWAKGRDFKVDGKTIEMLLTDSLRFQLFKQVGVTEEGEEAVKVKKKPSVKGVSYYLNRVRERNEQGTMEGVKARSEGRISPVLSGES
tara:strand:+ start:44493 stop:45965 length:1473 start_codon:yes stop_codon:yes gene_type:complete